MQDEQSFTQAMQQHPEDNALRLVFADWLEERGDPRGELIRLLHTLTQAIQVPKRKELEERLRSLLSSGVQPVGPFWTNSIAMKFAWIPAGTFLMGSPSKEKQRGTTESPRHQVRLSQGFYLAVHPVTQAAWQVVMGSNPSHFKGSDQPVEQVSWDDCQEFLRRWSESDGQAYRFPTEAEWEYACRAGTTSPFSFGETISTDQANYNGNYSYGKGKAGLHRRKTTTVGCFTPNALGLSDMHGNVWEWCNDWYGAYTESKIVDPQGPANGEYRVLRGGSFDDGAELVRSASRFVDVLPTVRSHRLGFRAARAMEARHS
jgi:uncharacterized protein (TIGR02996 family)